jgi:hypothetical protein
MKRRSNCLYCHAEFETEFDTKKFCNKKCRKRYAKNGKKRKSLLAEVKCYVCGKVSLRPIIGPGGRSSVTCGNSLCAFIHRKNRKAKKKTEHYKNVKLGLKLPWPSTVKLHNEHVKAYKKHIKPIKIHHIPICQYCGAIKIALKCSNNQCRIERKRATRKKKAAKRWLNPSYKARMALSHNLKSAIKRRVIWGKKTLATFRMLGYTPSQFKQHIDSKLQSGMSWENHGKIWEIDHIRPVVSFDIKQYGDAEMIKCWSLDNLQPLWATTAIARGHGSDMIGNREKADIWNDPVLVSPTGVEASGV